MACDGGVSHHPEREQWEDAGLGDGVTGPWGQAMQHRRVCGRLDHGAAHPADLLPDPLLEQVRCVGLDDCVRDVDHAVAGREEPRGEVSVFVGDLQLMVSKAWHQQ